jgi:L-cysteine S-thiosulfotransferase
MEPSRSGVGPVARSFAGHFPLWKRGSKGDFRLLRFGCVVKSPSIPLLQRGKWFAKIVVAVSIVGVSVWGSAGVHAQSSQAPEPPQTPFTIQGDAIPLALNGLAGDAARGRAIVANRQLGLCLLCHAAPISEERFQGNLAPSLDGVGSRLNEGQLRLRIVNSRATNPETIMPSYYQREGHTRVGARVGTRVGTAWQGKTILNAQQIEDVVAYLVTLQTPRQ